MSSFVLRRIAGQGGVDLVHRETGSVAFRCYPYFDAWPLRKHPTHWVIWPMFLPLWVAWLFAKRRRCW